MNSLLRKICTTCNQVKSISNFYKNRDGKHGVLSTCKTCASVAAAKYYKTEVGIIARIYGSQRSNSKIRGHAPPKYTKNELIAWLSNENFDELYKTWIESGYKKSLRPSIDRIDDYEGYSLGNIQLTTWGENEARGNADMINGINNKMSKAILQFTIGGKFISRHYSISSAARKYNIATSNICKACKGGYSQCGGFVWKYEQQENLK